jgi:trans-aconitate 2-methyltransferase
MPWNPDQYHQFKQERSAPFDDLLQLVNCRDGLEVVDLGCGTGELTRRLADTLVDSRVQGVDSSTEMLARANSQARPGLDFQLGQIENVRGKWDLVFSNAAIQWVDDHPALIPRLLGLVKPSGQLAVQLPSNHTSFAHRAITETAHESPFEKRWTVGHDHRRYCRSSSMPSCSTRMVGAT